MSEDDVASMDERMKAFDKQNHEEEEEGVRIKEEKQDISKVDRGMKAFDKEADRKELASRVVLSEDAQDRPLCYLGSTLPQLLRLYYATLAT